MVTPSKTRAREGIQLTSATQAVSKDAPAQEWNGGEGHKEKQQVIEGTGGNFVLKGVHTKGRGLERCTKASLQSQSCSEEGTSSVCVIKETDARDTSPLAYTKVKKKKGGSRWAKRLAVSK
ncbi:hypothetical protein OIU77_021176, partial [Salix suchowensis]